MGSIVNYYEELHLSQTMAADDIDFELRRQEKTWRKRELSQPEKAADMLALIKGAKEVFKSEPAKAAYDEELRKSMEEPQKEEPDAERAALFEKWLGKASEFYESNDIDLAESAIEKALSYYDEKSEDHAFLSRVARTYFDNGQADRALQYINKALMIDPSNWEYQYLKGQILLAKRDIQGAEDSYRKAAESAYKTEGDAGPYMYGVISDFLMRVKGDPSAAAVHAKIALNSGDPSGLAAKVMSAMESEKAHDVSLKELNDYKNEFVVFEKEIGNVVDEIISNYRPASGNGWPVCTKTAYYNEYDDNSLDYNDHDVCCRYKFVLDTTGTIKGYMLKMAKGSNRNWEPIGGGAERIMMETDFDGLWIKLDMSSDRTSAAENVTTSIAEIWNGLSQGLKNDEKNYVTVTRKTYQKGRGLYVRLERLLKELKGE